MDLRPVAYRTLATRIRDAIRDGEYADGRQLPTEEQLAASYSVSRQTVRRAMQDLVSEGIIYRVAGRGTYPVAEQDRYVNHFGSVEELMALSLDTECEVVSPLQRKVDENNQSIAAQNARLDTQRARLLKQFNDLESAIAKIKSNQSALSQIQPLSLFNTTSS